MCLVRSEFSSDLDIPKSKCFPSASTMVGPQEDTKPQSFSRALNCIAIALRKFENPDIKIDRLCTCGSQVIDL